MFLGQYRQSEGGSSNPSPKMQARPNPEETKQLIISWQADRIANV